MYDAIEHGADDEVERRPADVYSHATARRVRRRGRLCDRGDDDRQSPPLRATSSDDERGPSRPGGPESPARVQNASSVFTGNLGSCAFVANNPTNLPMGGGPKIDAHETVVRFNNFWGDGSRMNGRVLTWMCS